MTERDYNGALKAEFDKEIQSGSFGFNSTVSIENSTFVYHNKYQNDVGNEGYMKMDYHSHYLVYYSKNADTICAPMKNIIHWMYDFFP